MARTSSLWTLGICAALAFAATGAGADGVAYPTPPPAPTPRSVYGGWTTPQTGGYGSWTTPRSSGYGTWTTPQSGGYGTWASPSGSTSASRMAYGSPSAPSIPATATVVGSAPSSGWAPVCAPPCAPVAAIEEPCSGHAWRFGVWGRYWRPSIGGETLITTGGAPGSGTAVDLHRELNLDPANGFEGGVRVEYGRHRGTLAYESDSFSGSSRLDKTIVFHGVTFLAGTQVNSNLDLTIWKVGYDYAFVDTFRPGMMGVAETSLTVRAGVSGWLWDYNGRVQSATPAQDTTRGFSHLIPVATLSAEGSFEGFRVGARVDGGLLASDRYVVDAEASVGLKLWNVATLDVGYRWMNLSFHETTNEGDLTLYGPFAGVSIEF